MYEFYTYSSLAEDDIFLAALVAAAIAIFVRIEFAAPRDGAHSAHFLGTRRPAVLAFFALTGLTSMTKGPLLGVLVIAPTVAAFLLWTGGFRRLRQYVWLWGWLVVVAVTLAWPAYVYHRYPDVMENWLLDYARTKLYDEPFWYYGPMLLMAMLPWTPAALLGLWLLARKIRGGTLTPAERFAFCWAVVSIVALSLPHRKHHHYLVPSLAPWALVTAYGLFAFVPAFFRITARSRVPVVDVLAALAGTVALWLFRTKIPGPPWIPPFLIAAWLTCLAVWYTGVRRQNPRFLMAAVILGAAVTYSWGQSCLPDGTTDDTAFLRQVDATVPQDESLMVNADLRGDMDFFRNCFYLRPTATLLHNLSFLRDEQIRDPDVYVVTRANDRAALQTLGQVDQVLQSPKTRREKSPDERFTLFHVTFRPDLARYPAPPPDKITTIQAMGRKKGPYCGPDWPPQLQ
jgi:4-amino-4-deoxy-L-arabinose transferase-like glycosyltransferase